MTIVTKPSTKPSTEKKAEKTLGKPLVANETPVRCHSPLDKALPSSSNGCDYLSGCNNIADDSK